MKFNPHKINQTIHKNSIPIHKIVYSIHIGPKTILKIQRIAHIWERRRSEKIIYKNYRETLYPTAHNVYSDSLCDFPIIIIYIRIYCVWLSKINVTRLIFLCTDYNRNHSQNNHWASRKKSILKSFCASIYSQIPKGTRIIVKMDPMQMRTNEVFLFG